MSTRLRPALRGLLLESDPLDADVLTEALGQSYPECEVLPVDSAPRFQWALEDFAPDVILADHRVGQLSSLQALRLSQSGSPGVPFILVSQTFEQAASESLKGDAADFVRKEDLSRLAPAISRAQAAGTAAQVVAAATRGALAPRGRLVDAGDRRAAHPLGQDGGEPPGGSDAAAGIRDLAGLVRYAIRVGIVSSMQ